MRRSLTLLSLTIGLQTIAGALLLTSQAPTARAQVTRSGIAPKTASRPTTVETLQQVETLITRQDSLGALAVLDSALVRDHRNGPLWHRYGRIAWGMSKAEKGPVMRPAMIRLRMRADSAMRYATSFSPDSAQYFLDLGLYALETNNVFVRVSAKAMFDDGVKVARAQGRSELSAAMLDQLAMFEWRDYDNVNHRALEKSADEVPQTATPAPRQVANFSVGYEQLRPASAIIVDFLSINLNGSVPGTYRLTIAIEDQISKRTVRRSTTFDLTRD